jgi:hypothetical protein
VLASVFTHQGGYVSPQVFVDGFGPALWVGAAFSAIGVAAALVAPGRTPVVDVTVAEEREVAAVAGADPVVGSPSTA